MPTDEPTGFGLLASVFVGLLASGFINGIAKSLAEKSVYSREARYM